jgi:hypothetical protein
MRVSSSPEAKPWLGWRKLRSREQGSADRESRVARSRTEAQRAEVEVLGPVFARSELSPFRTLFWTERGSARRKLRSWKMKSRGVNFRLDGLCSGQNAARPGESVDPSVPSRAPLGSRFGCTVSLTVVAVLLPPEANYACSQPSCQVRWKCIYQAFNPPDSGDGMGDGSREEVQSHQVIQEEEEEE